MKQFNRSVISPHSKYVRVRPFASRTLRRHNHPFHPNCSSSLTGGTQQHMGLRRESLSSEFFHQFLLRAHSANLDLVCDVKTSRRHRLHLPFRRLSIPTLTNVPMSGPPTCPKVLWSWHEVENRTQPNSWWTKALITGHLQTQHAIEETGGRSGERARSCRTRSR